MCSCATTTLSVERTAQGWVQRATFSYPDLHEEDVEELVPLASPFGAAAVARGGGAAVTFSFLLLGDQNAGKSTFLHAFTNAEDPQFLELLSALPILSSSFLNAQICDASVGKPVMDEPPFIDTDVGRTQFLITLEDFAFFVDEFSLPIAVDELERLASDSVRYASIEVIEIGGDHLDRMIARPSTSRPRSESPKALELALCRSEELVGSAQCTVYFLNCAELFASAGGSTGASGGSRGGGDVGCGDSPCILDAHAVLRLARRFRYLATVLPRKQRVVLYLSRLPDTAVFDAGAAHESVRAANELLGTRLDADSLCARAASRAASRRATEAARVDPNEELHPGMALHRATPPHAALLCAAPGSSDYAARRWTRCRRRSSSPRWSLSCE